MHKGAIARLLRTDKPLNDEASASTLPADEATGRATAHACSIAIAAPKNTSKSLANAVVKLWAVCCDSESWRSHCSEAYLRCVEALAGLCGFQIT